MKHAILSIAICAVATIPAAADISTINVDFQPTTTAPTPGTVYTGLGMAPDTGTYWNEVNLGSSANLLTSDGTTVTTVGVSTQYQSWYSNFWWSNDLLEDRLYHGFTTSNPSFAGPAITLSGLNPDLLYDIYLYVGYFPQTFTINGTTKNLTAGDYEADQSNWVEGVQYVHFSGLNATDAGVIGIYNAPLCDRGAISGLQIQTSVIPLPGAGLLGILGLAAASVKLRKRV